MLYSVLTKGFDIHTIKYNIHFIIAIQLYGGKESLGKSKTALIDCMTKEYGQNLQKIKLGCSTICLRQRNFWVQGPTFQICCFKLSLQPWIWTTEVTHYQLEWRLSHASNMIREVNLVYKLYSNEDNICSFFSATKDFNSKLLYFVRYLIFFPICYRNHKF